MNNGALRPAQHFLFREMHPAGKEQKALKYRKGQACNGMAFPLRIFNTTAFCHNKTSIYLYTTKQSNIFFFFLFDFK